MTSSPEPAVEVGQLNLFFFFFFRSLGGLVKADK